MGITDINSIIDHQKKVEQTALAYDARRALGGVKFDQAKIRTDLLAFDALEATAEVLTHGATKYGDRNWEQGFNWMRIVGALTRHLFAYIRGEDRDPETGLLHLAHASCCLMMLLTFQLRAIGTDDRSKSSKI